MKWQGHSDNASRRFSHVLGQLLGKKSAYYLLTIAALALTLGAGWKWHG